MPQETWSAAHIERTEIEAALRDTTVAYVREYARQLCPNVKDEEVMGVTRALGELGMNEACLMLDRLQFAAEQGKLFE